MSWGISPAGIPKQRLKNYPMIDWQFLTIQFQSLRLGELMLCLATSLRVLPHPRFLQSRPPPCKALAVGDFLNVSFANARQNLLENDSLYSVDNCISIQIKSIALLALTSEFKGFWLFVIVTCFIHSCFLGVAGKGIAGTKDRNQTVGSRGWPQHAIYPTLWLKGCWWIKGPDKPYNKLDESSLWMSCMSLYAFYVLGTCVGMKHSEEAHFQAMFGKLFIQPESTCILVLKYSPNLPDNPPRVDPSECRTWDSLPYIPSL